MSYKPNEATLMAYLYDELSDEERRRVESYLAENEQVRKELEELGDARCILSGLKDKEVEVPSFVFNEPSKVVVSTVNSHGFFWKRSLAIAASVSFILLAGYLTQFRMSVDNGNFQMGFGDQGFSDEVIELQIQEALARNGETIDDKIADWQANVLQNVNHRVDAIGQEKLEEYLEQLRLQNIQTMMGLMESSELSQKKYTEDLLREFALYLDVQRQNDMDVIQAGFENLANDTQWNQMRTNQILTNLIGSSEVSENQY